MISRVTRQLKPARFQQLNVDTQPHPIPAINLKKPVIVVHGRKAMCDGLNTHPRIYMNLDGGQGTCSYCGNIYKQDSKHHH